MASEDARGALASLAEQEENNAPMLAIFGGAFALMLVFLLLVSVLSSESVRERLQGASEQGLHRIVREDGGAGYVVIVMPDSLRIVENGGTVALGGICRLGSAFVDYARQVYAKQRDQIVFFLLEGGVPVMAEARECLRGLWPGQALTIGWVMADNEFLKSVALDDIPAYIQEYVDEAP